MLHVIEQVTEPVADAVLRSMFAARKRVFVDLLKWDLPVIADTYEVDEFDSAHARYLVLTRPDGTHLASARLLPTIRPHLLDSHFAALCDEPPPCAADVFEITRFCLDRSMRAAERRCVRDRLVCALVEHANAFGIRSYTAIAEMSWFQQILAFGWRCRPLGLPMTMGRQTLAALRIDIEPNTLQRLAAAGIAARDSTASFERRAA